MRNINQNICCVDETVLLNTKTNVRMFGKENILSFIFQNFVYLQYRWQNHISYLCVCLKFNYLKSGLGFICFKMINSTINIILSVLLVRVERDA